MHNLERPGKPKYSPHVLYFGLAELAELAAFEAFEAFEALEDVVIFCGSMRAIVVSEYALGS